MSPTHNRKKVIRRAQKHGESLRAAALRRIQIWVPDVRSKSFAAQARRQSLAIARSPQEEDDLTFIESVAGWDTPRNRRSCGGGGRGRQKDRDGS
jgi:hypothetical protein